MWRLYSLLPLSLISKQVYLTVLLQINLNLMMKIKIMDAQSNPKLKKQMKKLLTMIEINQKVQNRSKKMNLMSKKCMTFKNLKLSQSIQVSTHVRNSTIVLTVHSVRIMEMIKLIKWWRRSQTLNKMKSPAKIMIAMKTFTQNLMKIKLERRNKELWVKIWQIIWS